MIILYLFFIELLKVIAIGVAGGLPIYLLLRYATPLTFWQTKKTAFIPILLIAICAFVWPFYTLHLQFQEWAEAEKKLCSHVSVEMPSELPRKRVAYYGSDKTKYGKGGTASIGTWEFLYRSNVYSIALYEPTKQEASWSPKIPLDGIEGEWKELWLANDGNRYCDAYYSFSKENPALFESALYNQKRNGIVGKCVAIRPITDETTINYLGQETKTKPVYRKGYFSLSIENYRLFNEVTQEDYVRLSTIWSTWPRYSTNFRSLFVATAYGCPKDQFLIRNRMTPPLNKTVFIKEYNYKELVNDLQ